MSAVRTHTLENTLKHRDRDGVRGFGNNQIGGPLPGAVAVEDAKSAPLV